MPMSRLPRVDDGHAAARQVAVAGDERRPVRLRDGGDHAVLGPDRLAAPLAGDADVRAQARRRGVEGEHPPGEGGPEQLAGGGYKEAAPPAVGQATDAVEDLG